MKVSDSFSTVIWRRTASKTPSAGKVLADFSMGYYLDGASVSVSPSLTEVGTDGSFTAYKLTVTLPGTKGTYSWKAEAASGTDQVMPGSGQVVVEAQDNDSLYASWASPIVSVINSGGPQGDLSFRIVNGDYAPVTFTARDQSGTAFDLSGWNNGRFMVENSGQTAALGCPYVQTTGITMTAGGVVTIAIPEAAGFYASLTGPLSAASPYSVTLYWQFTADQASDATKTRTLARGTLTIVRKES